MKRFFLSLAFIPVLLLCLSAACFAESESGIALMSMTGGLSFSDFALYDSSGATSARLLENSDMKATVTIANSQTTARNYYAVLAIYTDGGALSQCISQSGSIESHIDNPDSEGMKNISFSFKIPKLTAQTELKLMLFESPKIFAPNGSVYYTADINGVYQCRNGLKADINNEVYYYEGVVTDVPMCRYARDGYSSTYTPTITINGYCSENADGIGYIQTFIADCSGAENIDSYLGKRVCAYITQNQSAETGYPKLCDIREDRNKVTRISKARLVDADDREYEVEGQISYRKTGSTKVYDLDLAADTECYVNYEKVSTNRYLSTKELEELIENSGSIELIGNDNDDDIDVIIINAYDAEATIKSVSEEDGELSFTLYNGDLDNIDTTDEDSLVKVYKDGTFSDAKALAKGDTVSTVEVGLNVRILYASSKTVTGSVEAYDTADETVTIAGNDYELSPFLNKSVSSLKDEEGTFYLNADGQIAYNKSDSASSGTYGLVLAVDKDTGINDGYIMKIVLADGTVAEYDVASKAKYYDKNGYSVTTDDKTTAAKVAKIIGGSSANVEANTVKATAKQIADKENNGVFRFIIKDGKINKIKALKGGSISYLSANTKKYDAEAMTYGAAEFDKDTVVFAIDAKVDDTAELKVDDISVGEVSAFFMDGDDALTFVALDDDNGICGAVLGFDLGRGIEESSSPLVITGARAEIYNGDEATRVFGIRNGKEFSCIIYERNYDYSSAVMPEDLRTGDIIMISEPNQNGVSEDFKLLYENSTRTVDTAAAAGDERDGIFNASGMLDIERTKNSASKFYLDTDITNRGYCFAYANDGIAKKGSARYTLVECGEDGSISKISAADAGTAISTSRKYESYIFVRVYNDTLSDVVVYREAIDTAGGSIAQTLTDCVVSKKIDSDGAYVLELAAAGEYPISESCTFSAAGLIDQGAEAVYGRAETILGKLASGTLPIYEYTVTNGEITAVKGIAFSGRADNVQTSDYSSAAYSFKGVKLSKDTSIIEVVCGEDGSIISAGVFDIGDSVGNETSTAWVENGGTASALIFIRKERTPVYSLVTAVDINAGIDESYIIQSVMQDGAVRIYTLAPTVKFNEIRYDDRNAANKLSKLICGSGFNGSYPSKLLAANAANAVVSLSFDESGRVKSIESYEDDLLSYLGGSSLKYNSASMTYGGAAFDEDTVLFVVKDAFNGSDAVSADRVIIGTVDDYLKNGRVYNLAAVNNLSSAYGAAVVFGTRIEPDVHSRVMAISSVQPCEYNDGDAVAVYGIMGGVKTGVIICNEDDDYTSSVYPDELCGGDIIQLSKIRNGVSADFNTLYHKSLTQSAADGDPENEVYHGFGGIASLNQGSIAIDSAISAGGAKICPENTEIRLSPDAVLAVVRRLPYGDVTVECPANFAGITGGSAYIRYENGKAADVVIFDDTEPDTAAHYEPVVRVDGELIETCKNLFTITESSVFLKDGQAIAAGAEIAKHITPYDEDSAKISELCGCVYKLVTDGNDNLISVEQCTKAGSIENAPYNILTRRIGGISFDDGTQYIYAEYKSSRDELYCVIKGFYLENNNLYDVDYFSEDGKVVAAIVSRRRAAPNYGLVLAVDRETGINDSYIMQVMLADGTVSEYMLSSSAKFYGDDGRVVFGDKRAADAVTSIIGAQGMLPYRTTAKDAVNGLFDFTISNGKITKIKELGGKISYLSANTKRYDAETMTYGAAEFDKDTVVFAIDAKVDDTAVLRAEDISSGKVADFFNNGDDALTFVALDESYGICGAVVGFDIKTSVPENSAAVIISGIKTVAYDGDDAVQITGIRGGKEVTYTIYDEDADYASSVAPEDLKKGDVILVAAANAENVVSDFKTLYQADNSGKLGTVDADAKYDIYNAVANLDVTKTKDSNNKFYLDADVANTAEVFAAAADGLTMRASANYTLVDYTESTKNPTVEKKSSSATLSTSGEYKTVVFVRVYGGALTEVVAYRFNK